MKAASYMLPEEHVKEIERLCYEQRVTQDEIVRRAISEYIAKESSRTNAGFVPSEIKTGSLGGI